MGSLPTSCASSRQAQAAGFVACVDRMVTRLDRDGLVRLDREGAAIWLFVLETECACTLTGVGFCMPPRCHACWKQSAHALSQALAGGYHTCVADITLRWPVDSSRPVACLSAARLSRLHGEQSVASVRVVGVSQAAKEQPDFLKIQCSFALAVEPQSMGCVLSCMLVCSASVCMKQLPRSHGVALVAVCRRVVFRVVATSHSSVFSHCCSQSILCEYLCS